MCPSHDPLRWSAVQMSAAAIPRAKAKLLQFKVPGSTLFFRVFTHVPSVNIYIYITYYILHIIYYILYITYYMLHVHIYIYTHYYCIYIYGYPKIWWFMTIVPVEIVIGHHMRGSPWIPWPARHWAILWRRQSLQCERPRLQGVVPICASPYSACFIFAWLVRTEKNFQMSMKSSIGFYSFVFLSESACLCVFNDHLWLRVCGWWTV